MGSVPVLKPGELCRLLEKLGFTLCASAAHMCNTATLTGAAPRCPCDKGRDIAPPLLRQIAKDIGLTAEELIARL